MEGNSPRTNPNAKAFRSLWQNLFLKLKRKGTRQITGRKTITLLTKKASARSKPPTNIQFFDE